MKNIREDIIDEEQIEVIKENIRRMEINHVTSLTYDLFGHYSDPRSQVLVKNNIKKIAKVAWDKCNEQTKYEFGIKSGQYAVSGDSDRAKLSKGFLELVDGLSYLSEEQRIIDMRTILDDLNRVHNAFNNFYNEPPFAKQLIKYISGSGEIPNRIRKIYVDILLRCSIGNYYGVSREANTYYHIMIKLFQENEISAFLDFLIDEDCYLNTGYSPKQIAYLQNIANLILPNVINQIFKRALNIIIKKKKLGIY